MLTIKLFNQIRSILHKYQKYFIINLLSTFFISLFNIIDSLVLSYIIDNSLNTNSKLSFISIILFMFILTFLNISLSGIKNLLTQKLSYKIEIHLSDDFFETVINQNFTFLEKHKTGELISKLNDTIKVRVMLSEGLISLLTNIIIFFVIGFALLKINMQLFFILLISTFIMSIISIFFWKFYKRYFVLFKESYSDLQSFITNCFLNIETIKTMPATNNFKKEYKKRQKSTLEKSFDISEKSILQKSLGDFIEKLTSILILLFGCFFVISNKMSLGQVIAFISLCGFFSTSVSELLDLQASYQESLIALKRLFEILNSKQVEEETEFLPEANNLTISFNNINFSYPDTTNIFNNFSLSIYKGEWISLVGKTGCGKTTLIKLLLKFYSIQEGSILLNNTNLYKINTNWLYKKIAYIPQHVALFSGTIIDNITLYTKNIEMNRIIEITKLTGIYDKIISLPNKFNTLVSENGSTLSGGEKQKIAITRALLKDPLLIIFDEATSNLDIFSEKQITKIIKTLHEKGLSIITIAHKLSTITECDRIIVLENGSIVEEGSHLELLSLNGTYSKMVL